MFFILSTLTKKNQKFGRRRKGKKNKGPVPLVPLQVLLLSLLFHSLFSAWHTCRRCAMINTTLWTPSLAPLQPTLTVLSRDRATALFPAMAPTGRAGAAFASRGVQPSRQEQERRQPVLTTPACWQTTGPWLSRHMQAKPTITTQLCKRQGSSNIMQ